VKDNNQMRGLCMFFHLFQLVGCRVLAPLLLAGDFLSLEKAYFTIFSRSDFDRPKHAYLNRLFRMNVAIAACP
jgi:hypothetical protein